MKNRKIIKVIHRWGDDFIKKRLDVRMLTAFSTFAIAILIVTEFLVKVAVGSRPSLDNNQALVAFMTGGNTGTLLVVTIDTLLMVCLITFFAAFRQIIIRAQKDLTWITDLAFGAGLVFVAITLVGDAMDAGAALDTVGMVGNASVIRALTEGHVLMFGMIGCVLTALITATFAYTIFASNALPKWAGWVGYIVAIFNLAAIPSTFNGTNPHDFTSAAGMGVVLLATFPFLAWIITIGIVTIRKDKKNYKLFK